MQLFFLGAFDQPHTIHFVAALPSRNITTDAGKVCIEIRYGAKVIELSKGKSAIEITSPAALIEALEAVKTAVLAGELDAQIEQASVKVEQQTEQAMEQPME
jgi:hypothetical protein